MRPISQPVLILAGCVILAVITMIVLVQFSSTGSTSNQKERILLYDSIFPEQVKGYAKISDLRPNMMWFFSYPSSVKFNATENTFQTFLLIRLPVWLGGNNTDVSAFRAYSAVDLSSHCLMKYWPQEGRQRIEDPCWSPGYRVIDGVSIYPGNMFLRGSNSGALPQLELSLDNDGYLYVEPPVWTPEKNGSIGIGRNVSEEEILKSSEFLVQSYKNISNFNFDIPVKLSTGEILTELEPGNQSAEVFYSDPESTSFARIYLTSCTCFDSLDFLTEQYRYDRYRQLWEINSEPIIITGQALYTGEDYVENPNKSFIFNFVKEGRLISFEINRDFDSSSRVVLENFFDGTSISEMHRIS